MPEQTLKVSKSGGPSRRDAGSFPPSALEGREQLFYHNQQHSYILSQRHLVQPVIQGFSLIIIVPSFLILDNLCFSFEGFHTVIFSSLADCSVVLGSQSVVPQPAAASLGAC